MFFMSLLISRLLSTKCLHFEVQVRVNVFYDHCRQVPPVDVDVYAGVDVLRDAGEPSVDVDVNVAANDVMLMFL